MTKYPYLKKKKGSKLPINFSLYKKIRQVILKEKGRCIFRNLFLVNVQVNTSLRASDLLNLKVGDVYREGRFIEKLWLEQKKTCEQVAIFIYDSIMDDLEQIRMIYEILYNPGYFDNPTNPLFPASRKDRTGCYHALSYNTYQSLFKCWISKIGLNPDLYGTHSLRSAVPMIYYYQTRDLLTTSKLFGHSSVKTTEIYVKEVSKFHAVENRKKYQFHDHVNLIEHLEKILG